MMCFTNECDWYAEVIEDKSGEADTKAHCDECGDPIERGEWRRTIFQQQSERCRTCDDEDLDCEHNYGESFDYVCCEPCDKLLRAIEAREIEEGCPPGARRPGLTGLHETMHDHESRGQYAEKARTMFPEIAGHRLLNPQSVE